MSKLILYPFGDATVSALADAATMNVTIQNNLTVLKATAGFGQAVTGLSLTAHAELKDGAEVIVDIKQGATGRNVAFGSAGNSIVAPALTGVALDRDVIRLRYDATEDKFIAMSAWQKVFDAA